MVSIFISYSHVDEELRRQLDVHLAALKRQQIVDVWHDRQIIAGRDLGNEIDAALTTAQVILLLVSADFIASDYCYSVELREAIRRHEANEAVVIPVILRDCDWHDLPFGKLRATPTDGKPVRLFADLDSAFLEVVRDIKRAVAEIGKRKSAHGAKVVDRPISAPEAPQVRDMARSGNLRIKVSFTDFDRAQYREETFEYIARHFENSLNELQARNPRIRSRFVRVDAVAFEAAAYDVDGKEQSKCGVWLATSRGFAGDIGYSSNGVGNRNSYNESLLIRDDGTSLGLTSMGFSGAEENGVLLTQEGGAERLWSMFIGPMQK